MRNIRLISKLDVKPPHLVKGIQFEGLRKLGNPNVFAKKYYEEGIDEIIYEDVVASLYERNSLEEIIQNTTDDVFVPITVSGGIRSLDDIRKVLRSGADKIAINTEAIKNPKILEESVTEFGSSTIVLSIQAKRTKDGWEAYYDNGRERSYKDVVDWAKQAQDLGVGEILINSVDYDGTLKGFDTDLINSLMKEINIPIIASGGMGKLEHIRELVERTSVDAVAIASVLHYNSISISEIKQYCNENNFPIRI